MNSRTHKLFAVLSTLMIIVISLGFAHANDLECEEGRRLTETYTKQEDSCKNGNKVKSSHVMSLVKDKNGIEALRALLENDCIDGFRNSIGSTIADDWAISSKEDTGLQIGYPNNAGIISSLAYYYMAKVFDWLQSGENEDSLEKYGKTRAKLKFLINSPWFTEAMRDRIGLTEFDIALLKGDEKQVVAMLDAMPDIKDNTPAQNAELFRFMSSSAAVLQYFIFLHDNYSGHLISSHIKDPKVDTVVIISGPGVEAWSYPEFNYAIDIVEQLGLNWILVGDGVRSITLEDVKQIEPLLSGLENKPMFWVYAHGEVDKESGKHVITLDQNKDAVTTSELFEVLKTISGNKAIDILFDSCYGGAAYTDAIELFPEGSRFISTAPVDYSSSYTGKAILNGVGHLMKSHDKFDSVFELFSLGLLYDTVNCNHGPQIYTSTSNKDSLILKLDEKFVDFECVFENQENIINYLSGYLDEETLEAVKIFIDPTKRCSGDLDIDDGNLSRIVQYAVGITRNDLCSFKENIESVNCEKSYSSMMKIYRKNMKIAQE